MRSRLVILLVVILVFFTWGAQVKPNLSSHTESQEEHQSVIQNAFVKVIDLEVEPHTLYRNLDFDFTYTSFIFEVVEDIDFIGTYYHTEWGERYAMDSIPVTDQPSHVIRSPFIIPDKAQSRFTFNSGEVSGKLRLYLLYAPPMELDFKQRLSKTEAYCEKPDVVRGSVWRDGLPDAKGVREVHSVNHCILHHSAGSNTKTDYVNVVRNIFLLHTQTNGWDDIGYNFVVAQDGTIFEGREHQNKDSTDNIKGAHFCGKNTNTMGICLLGNYMTTSPTLEALQSIEHLFTWKCYKDGIKPLGSTNHPTFTSPLLPNIAGHQDGCATACPGDSLYRLLPNITWRVDSILKKCLPSQHSEVKLLKEDLIWYVDQSTGALQINLPKNHTWLHGRITNASGQTITTLQIIDNEHVKSVYGLNSGLYIAEFYTSEQELLRCKVIYSE